MKVKLISVAYVLTNNYGFKTIDEEINEFISEIEGAEIVDIKYSSHVNQSLADSYKQNYSCTRDAMIIYKQ